MILKTFITKLRQCAGWRKTIKNTNGGAFSILIIGLMLMLVMTIVLVNIADYSIYSLKRNTISKAIDYSVCAAIQEINIENSSQGLKSEFGLEGEGNTDNIFIDETNADNAFFNTFKSNSGIDKDKIQSYMLIVIVNPTSTGLNYIIKKDAQRFESSVSSPKELEEIINSKIGLYFSDHYEGYDAQCIYVNGNPKTNEFKKRPYYMVFIKNYEIDGLFKKRTATFIGFTGAKIERM